MSEKRTMWLVLRVPVEYSGGVELIGLFDEEPDAMAAAEPPLDIVGPLEINIKYADGDWKGVYVNDREASGDNTGF